MRVFLGCIKCMRCSLLLLLIVVSVSLSVTLATVQRVLRHDAALTALVCYRPCRVNNKNLYFAVTAFVTLGTLNVFFMISDTEAENTAAAAEDFIPLDKYTLLYIYL